MSGGNAIQRNRIFDNAGLGIDLGDDGVTANDALDADNGPNFVVNFPVLNSVTIVPAGVRVTGSINTVPNSIIRIEFFSSPAADGSTHGEGNRYLGFVMVQVLAATRSTSRRPSLSPAYCPAKSSPLPPPTRPATPPSSHLRCWLLERDETTALILPGSKSLRMFDAT